LRFVSTTGSSSLSSAACGDVWDTVASLIGVPTVS
jgi:hypothetical protein